MKKIGALLLALVLILSLCACGVSDTALSATTPTVDSSTAGNTIAATEAAHPMEVVVPATAPPAIEVSDDFVLHDLITFVMFMEGAVNPCIAYCQLLDLSDFDVTIDGETTIRIDLPEKVQAGSLEVTIFGDITDVTLEDE